MRRMKWGAATTFGGIRPCGLFCPTRWSSLVPPLPFEDDREDYGEQRWVTLGLLRGKVVVIVHTETQDEIHVISIREADKDEQLLFFSNL